MIFDKLCGIAERIPTFEILKPILRDAKLFSLPVRPQDILAKEIDNYEILDNFFLPFQVTAIEDLAGLTILIDDKPDTVGLNVERRFVDVVDLSTPIDNFDPRNMREASDYKKFKEMESVLNQSGYLAISFGYVEEIIPDSKTKFKFMASTTDSYMVSRDRIISDLKKTAMKMGDEESLISPARNAGVALQEVIYFNSPKRFILKQSNVKQRKKNKKIPRSSDRPIYTLLKPNEIREKLSLPEPKGDGRKSPESHFRRRHYRTYKDDRFVNMKGQTIVVPAQWIGPQEKEIGNKRYKVMVDL